MERPPVMPLVAEIILLNHMVAVPTTEWLRQIVGLEEPCSCLKPHVGGLVGGSEVQDLLFRILQPPSAGTIFDELIYENGERETHLNCRCAFDHGELIDETS